MYKNFLGPLALMLVSGMACLLNAAEDTPTTAAAQARGAEGTSTYNLEKVGVTAKRLKESPTSTFATTESSQLLTEVLTVEEIEAIHPQTFWDLMDQVPGMEVTYQGRQHMEFTNMRGGGSFGIIVDGAYLSQPDRIMQALPMDAMEQVTVVRDATALTLGPLSNVGGLSSVSNSSSNNEGFVILRTKRAKGPEAGVTASYGSYNAEKYSLYGGDKIGRFDYRLSGTFDNQPGKPGWNMETRNTTFVLSGGYTGDTFDARLLSYYGHGKRNMEWGWTGTAFSGSSFNMVRCDPSMIALTVDKRWTPSQTTTFSYGYNGVNVFTDTKNAPTHDPDQNSYTNSLTARHVIVTGNNVMKAGFQRMTYRAMSSNVVSTNFYVNSLFLEDEYRMLGGRLTVDAGIRVDQKTLGITSSHKKVQTAAASPSYTTGFSYKPVRLLTLTGRFAVNQNDPSSYMHASAPVGQPSPDLPSERIKKFELGAQASLHPIFNPWVTTYRYFTQNALTSTTGPDYSSSTPSNFVSSYFDPNTGEEIDYMKTTAELVKHGYEAGASGQIVRPLGYKVSFSYVNTSDSSTNIAMSHHFVSAALRYTEGTFGANVSARYVGPKYQSVSPAGTFNGKMADFWRMDANLTKSFKLKGHDAKLTVYGRNLGDRHYCTRYVTGYYLDPGFLYGVELSYKFF